MVVKVEIYGLETIPEVKPGDDVAELIVEAAARENVGILDGDILVISQKIVSKAEGRLVKLDDIPVSSDAKKMAEKCKKDPRLVELVLREGAKVLKAARGVLISLMRNGFVAINAGIDKSNVNGGRTLSLLPKDPDESARKIRTRIREITGKNVGVIISDTSSRPFRRGVVDFAVGVSGVPLFKDYCGKPDMYGYTLKVTKVAIVDELAAAAELVKGQGSEGRPVAIVRGYSVPSSSEEGIEKMSLLLSDEEDLFSGTL